MDQEQIKSEIKQYINRLVDEKKDEKKDEIHSLSDKELKRIQQSSRGYNSKEKDDGFTLVVIVTIASGLFEILSQLIAILGGK